MAATRRSARIRMQDNPAPAAVAISKPAVTVSKPAVTKATASKKRSAPAGEPVARKRSATRAPVSKASSQDAASALPSSTPDKLSSMPPEILEMILDNITEPSSIGRLGRTCKRYHAIMAPRLHKRVVVAAMFHAHIRKLIRALEPYLSVAQKKQLKREGKYVGQQERYPAVADPNLIPACADHVRELVIGVVGPGRKHEYIVYRYLEEALKNMKNLEIVETRVLTKSMATSLASLKGLKGLRIVGTSSEADATEPLEKIKNLQYLSVEAHRYDSAFTKCTTNMIGNSLSQLRNLALETTFDPAILFPAPGKSGLNNLTTLKLRGYSSDGRGIQSMLKVVDFAGLRELHLGSNMDISRLLLDHLSIYFSSRKPGKEIALQKLFIDASLRHRRDDTEGLAYRVPSQCQFLSSFDTLKYLEIQEYNQYPDGSTPESPELCDTLLQAILKHRNLKSLKFSYRGMLSGCTIPYMSAETVKSIVSNLPDLEDFQFAPEENDIDEIGKALAQGTNLTSVTCFPHRSWGGWPRPEAPGINILTAVVNGVMSRHGGDSGEGPENPVWEDYSKLRTVSVVYKQWEVASKFGKTQKGMAKPVKVLGEGEEKREVMYRDISASLSRGIHIGYDPDHAWLESCKRS